MSAGGMLLSARYTVTERRSRRRGQPFGDVVIAACIAYLEASRAVDDALERLRKVQHRPETTLEEDEQVERAAGDAWEALFAAAIELDTVLPDPEHGAADSVRLLASLHNPPSGWTPYSHADGTRSYDDGCGRTIAILTPAGEVAPGPWFKRGQALPPPPPFGQ
jgi:hypothetical protein